MESESLTETCQIIMFIIDNWHVLLVLLFFATIFAVYLYHTSTFDHFEKRGVVFMKPKLFVGSVGKKLMGTQSMSELSMEIYNKFKGCRYAGVFESRLPMLYILDPDLIKAVIIKDFDHFVDRTKRVYFNQGKEFIIRSLIMLSGSDWREVRSTLTPTFSSARLKHMLPLMESCSKQMVDYLQKLDGTDVEMKEIMGRYTLEVIGVTAFGITSDALYDEKSQFVKLAEKSMTLPPFSNKLMIYISLIIYPNIARAFHLPTFSLKIAMALVKMVQETQAQRKKTGQKKNDFLQLLMDAAEKEKNAAEKGKKIQLDDNTVNAQAFVFMMAGFDTSSTLLSFATHILATKPEIQKKLREHIKEKTEGKEMSYDLLSELTYLEGFLLETLRLFPPLARIERVCTKNYVLPGTNVEVKKREMIAIPIVGIHMDPEIYEDPTEFKPERFIGDAKREIPSHLYLAFGTGPRNCIGSRFAMYSAKTIMVHLLKNFEFQVCPKTEDPVKIHKRAALLKAESGIWIKLNKL